jgi:hypothetical protein
MVCYTGELYYATKIDAPGVLNHVIVRGIECGKIFRSDYDQNFLKSAIKIDSCFGLQLIRITNHLSPFFSLR